jgi:diguanylate cyclase (GGDEF)-like protein/PAS domain S-box-containing protein
VNGQPQSEPQSADASQQQRLLLAAVDVALDHIDLGVVRHDADGIIVAANATAAILLGLTRDQLLGRDSFDPRWRALGEDGQVMPGDQHPAMVALATGREVRDATLGVEVPERGLRWLSVSAFPVPAGPGESGVTGGVTAVFRDITATAQGDRALRTWEQRYRLAAELAPVGIAILSHDGFVLRANRAFTELFQTAEAVLQRAPWHRVLPIRDPESFRPLTAALLAGERSQVTVQVALTTAPVRHARIHVGVVIIPDQPFEFVVVAEDVTEEVARRDQLERRADHDALTGLLNLPALLRRAPSGADAGPMAAVFVDVDAFKQVNDEHGHAAGDAVLVAIARRILTEVRHGDLVARAGGDEFVLLLPGIDADHAIIVAERIVASARRSVRGPAGPILATVSAGVAMSEGDATVGDVMRRADRAMYVAKAQGRDRLHAELGTTAPGTGPATV